MKIAKQDLHPLGLLWGASSQTCGECVWSRLRGPGPKVLRCVAANNQRINSEWKACSNWEGSHDCLVCAACCGPAYDAVEVAPRDPVRKKHPNRIETVDGRYQLKRRSDNHCSALLNNNCCQIYQDRPRCCQDFEVGGDNCLFARRRLGFTKAWR